MKKKLEEQEARIGGYKKRHAGELPQQVDSNLAVLQRLNGQLQLNSEKQIRAMERRDKSIGEVADAGTGSSAVAPGDLETRLEQLTLEMADLRRQYTDNYPDVVRLQREIADLKRRLAEPAPKPPQKGAPSSLGAAKPPVAAGPLRQADAEMASLKHEEERLRRSIAEYERRIDSVPQRQQEFQALSRDYETTKDLYDSLMRKYDDAQLVESMEHGQATEQFRVLDPAIAPQQAVAPNRVWLALMTLMVSIGAAVVAMAVAEQIDTSFHSVDSLRAFTRVPVLARIPRIVTRADVFWKVVRTSLAIGLLAIGLAAAAGASYYAGRNREQLVFILGGGRP